MDIITTPDGTRLALERHGTGHPVVLIGGAFNDRSTMTALAAQLIADPSNRLATVQYDRRGRGDSDPIAGDPSGTERLAMELADLAAVIDSVGGAAHVFGHSSGGVLALEAAARGLGLTRVAVYEPSYVVPGTRPVPVDDLGDRIAGRIAGGDRDGAVATFLSQAVGLPEEYLEPMQGDDATWGGMTALAHTLPNDVALHGPSQSIPPTLTGIPCPVLVLDGDASPDWVRTTAATVSAAIDGARHQSLPGQDHSILWAPDPLLGPLTAFLR